MVAMSASSPGRHEAPVQRVDGAGESAHCFDPGLVGILSRPRPGTELRTGVILLNAGLVHHAGPFRSYVQLARALSSQGFPVLRFDQSGLGDSAVSKVVVAQRRNTEVRAAIDFMAAETGADRFVVGGICSAADDAFHVSGVEPRISGLLLIDGLAYRTMGYWLRFLTHLFTRKDKLLCLLKWRRANSPGLKDFRDFPDTAVARQRMRELVAQDKQLLFLFTSGAHRYFNHHGQLAACLGAPVRTPQVSLEYWPGCDHTFYLQEHRDRMLATVVDWVRSRFGEDATIDARTGAGESSRAERRFDAR